MMAFQYPKHPNTGRRDPTRDPSVANPFAESSSEDLPADENPYAPAAAIQVIEYRRGDVETIYPHRGRLLFRLGLAGFVASVVGACGAMGLLWTGSTMGASLLSLFAMLLFAGWPTSWTAWWMARADLQAMQAGAMDNAGRRRTRLGWFFGLAGGLAASAPAVYLLYLLFRTIAEAL